jgi:hypothetical protein
MNLEGTRGSAFRFAAYVGELTSVIGHADREKPLNDYCAGKEDASSFMTQYD